MMIGASSEGGKIQVSYAHLGRPAFCHATITADEVDRGAFDTIKHQRIRIFLEGVHFSWQHI
jgi:hypothetical protein